MSIFKVFSKNKSFGLPIIGNVFLNKKGLHIFRIILSDIFLALRRVQVSGFSRSEEFKQFKRDGIVAIPNFLSEKEFCLLEEEIKERISAADSLNPIQNFGESGFGEKHDFLGGFDRYDGGTLNRFYNIHTELKQTHSFLNNKRLKRITSQCAGTYHDMSKYYLYKLLHGKEESNSDIQKAIHRDTFHSSIKLWYFIDDVTEKHGPFHYVPSSHKMTSNRLKWEKEKSIMASKNNTGGAFRINSEALTELKQGSLQAYPVKANTLVIADIRGFHCRGLGVEGQERLSIYANIRPSPFLFAFNASRFRSIMKSLKVQ